MYNKRVAGRKMACLKNMCCGAGLRTPGTGIGGAYRTGRTVKLVSEEELEAILRAGKGIRGRGLYGFNRYTGHFIHSSFYLRKLPRRGHPGYFVMALYARIRGELVLQDHIIVTAAEADAIYNWIDGGPLPPDRDIRIFLKDVRLWVINDRKEDDDDAASSDGEGLGLGLTTPGTGLFDDIGKAFSSAATSVVKVLTSKPVKQAVRAIRSEATPFIKQQLPGLIDQGLDLATSTPETAFLKPLAPIASNLINKGAQKGVDELNNLADKQGYGLRAPGYGFHDDIEKYVRNPHPRPYERSVATLGDESYYYGDGLFDDIGKAFSSAANSVADVLTSKPVKNVIRNVRNEITPIVKKELPGIINQGLQYATNTPETAFLKPLAPIASNLINKGAQQGVDGLNSLAEKHGYGCSAARCGCKKRRTTLDRRSLQLFNDMLVPSVNGRRKIKGYGLAPL